MTSLGYGLGLTAGVFVCEITRACSFTSLMIFGAQTGILMCFTNATVYAKIFKVKKISNDQELIQSDPTSCPISPLKGKRLL